MIVHEYGKILGYRIIFTEIGDELGTAYQQGHFLSHQLADDLNLYEFHDERSPTNKKHGYDNANEKRWDASATVMATNFKNAKRVLGCPDGAGNYALCKMLENKNEKLIVIEEKRHRRTVPTSEW